LNSLPRWHCWKTPFLPLGLFCVQFAFLILVDFPPDLSFRHSLPEDIDSRQVFFSLPLPGWSVYFTPGSPLRPFGPFLSTTGIPGWPPSLFHADRLGFSFCFLICYPFPRYNHRSYPRRNTASPSYPLPPLTYHAQLIFFFTPKTLLKPFWCSPFPYVRVPSVCYAVSLPPRSPVLSPFWDTPAFVFPSIWPSYLTSLFGPIVPHLSSYLSFLLRFLFFWL